MSLCESVYARVCEGESGCVCVCVRGRVCVCLSVSVCGCGCYVNISFIINFYTYNKEIYCDD